VVDKRGDWNEESVVPHLKHIKQYWRMITCRAIESILLLTVPLSTVNGSSRTMSSGQARPIRIQIKS